MGTIGVGSAPGDFEVLRAMTQRAKEYGSVATFNMPELTSASLGLVMTSLASSLTETRTEMTVLGGSRQRIVRDVRREMTGMKTETRASQADWYIYNNAKRYNNKVTKRLAWSKSEKKLVDVSLMQVPGANGIAYHKALMPGGEGQERMVHRFREIDAANDFTFLGPEFVAKESRFTDSEDKKPEFHKVFCETQAIAQTYAVAFNERLDGITGITCANHTALPRVQFLECSVYVLDDAALGVMSVLVENMLDGNYTKWNSNGGYVNGQDKTAAKAKLAALEEREREREREEAELTERLARRKVHFDLGPDDESDEEEDSDEDDDTGRKVNVSCCTLRPRTTPSPEENSILGVMYGVLLWADMNAATPPGSRGRSALCAGTPACSNSHGH